MLTLAGQGVINVDTPKSRACFRKYIRRGFEFRSHFPNHTCKATPYCNKTLRSIEDEHVLKIAFQPEMGRCPTKNLAPFMWRLQGQNN
ncbi:hypothetical protein CVT26_012852 [Gymnopilus dilepis]|uniref:Uncharacterized protein n=1 Tax=Gymnopilus dilepis TaxID=231916 RepID=A0A409Y492_9AGAR|nr:hypothetical protein CVT26_012852 [Gymnopilus dilepis]